MIKIYKILFVLLAAVYIPTSYAGDYVGSGTIKWMQSAWGTWILGTNGANANPDGCSKNGVILPVKHSQHKEIYSLLLSAYTTAKPVNIYVNGCDSVSGYKKLSFVYSAWNN